MYNNVKSPYAPLTADEIKQGQNIQTMKHDQDGEILINPIPDRAEIVYPYHKLGQPQFKYAYKDRQGKRIFFVCRFITKNADGSTSKQELPLTLWKGKDGKHEWRWKGVCAPRPLYGLEKLDQRPNATVLIVEGEKTADAAQNIFSDLISITSPNGAGSANHADWTPLKDRDVVIWRDHDQQGLGYQKDVIQNLNKVGVRSISLVKISDDFPEKWDLADPIPQGYTDMDIQNMLKNTESCIIPQIQEINDPPDDYDIAQMVINSIGSNKMINYAGKIHIYDDQGLWKNQTDRALKKLIQDFLKPHRHKMGYKIKRGKIDAILEALKNETYTEVNFFDDKKYFLNLLNGELHCDDVSKEWKLKPHNQESYCLTRIPIEYDPEATAPRFEQYLEEIFKGDDDKYDKKQATLELIIYTMMQHTDYEAIILLYGMGSNGKSLLLNLLEYLIGKGNIASVGLSSLNILVKRYELFGKSANIVAEIDSNEKVSDAGLKQIASGDYIAADIKYKDSLSFRPYATCWFNINALPYTHDTSHAFFRRIIIISFNNIIAEKDQDRQLLEKLTTEKSGIFNLALKAYKNVLSNNKITRPQSSYDIIENWKREVDHMNDFLDDCCVITQNDADQVLTVDLYKEYKKWQVNQCEKPLTKHHFERSLTKKHITTHKGAQGKRCRKGIKLLKDNNL